MIDTTRFFRIKKILNRYWKNTNGGAAFIFGIGAVVLISSVGLSIDFGRAYLVRSKLSSALDAAVLAAGKEFTSETIEQNVQMYFKVNYPSEYMKVTLNNIQMTKGDNQLKLELSGSIPTTFMRVIGKEKINFSIDNSIIQKNAATEIALVMDNTGSLGFDPFIDSIKDCSGGGCNNIQALKDGAKTLIDVLYGEKETVDGLHISLVPYSSTVNIGPEHTDWLDNTPSYFDASMWKGCVMARHLNGNDRTDATPTEEPFEPYYLNHTRDQLFYPNQNTNADPIVIDRYLVVGDNNYNTNPNTIREAPEDYGIYGNLVQGPNIGCPPPLTPLTDSKTTLIDAIGHMNGFNRGGTNAFLGLSFGLRTLSPKWRDFYYDGSATLPSDFNSPNRRKIVIILSDGFNGWFDWPGARENVSSARDFRTIITTEQYRKIRREFRSGEIVGVYRGAPGSPVNNDYPDADMTGYGRLSEGRLGTTSKSAVTAEINNRMLQTCDTMKTSQGITVYTMLFGNGVNPNNPNDATANLYKQCASSPENFFHAPTKEELRESFETIANRINTLRLNS